MPDSVPKYLQVSDAIRRRIQTGELAAGQRVPSETMITKEWRVSKIVAKMAIQSLKEQGLVIGVPGSGVFVRAIHLLVRDYSRGAPAAGAGLPPVPFARDLMLASERATFEHHSEEAVASEIIAARLAIKIGDPVMKTTYRFLVDEKPAQLSVSWEPLGLTAGTPVMWPEAGVGAGEGVVARLARIGITVDDGVEDVTVHPATREEIEALKLPYRGAPVLHVARTYLAAGEPVETADIVMQGDRFLLRYRIPIR
jgi:DNA-binding GntR family transcriptional regulator